MNKDPKKSIVIRAWSLLVVLIRKEGKALGLRDGEIESAIGVGDQTGQVLNSWIAGKRTPNSIERNRIFDQASRLGWLSMTDSQIAEFAYMPDKWAQEFLTNAFHQEQFELPSLLLSLSFNPAVAAKKLFDAMKDPSVKKTRLLAEVRALDTNRTCERALSALLIAYQHLQSENYGWEKSHEPFLSPAELDQYWINKLTLGYQRLQRQNIK